MAVRNALPLLALLFGASALADAPDGGGLREERIDVHSFSIIEHESGKVNYYSVTEHPDGAYLHSAYKYPYETAVIGWRVPETLRRSVAKLRWKWRAVILPKGGDECAKGKGDSAAVVYITWKRGLRWYTLKYVWSAVGTKGMVCDTHRNPFVAQDTIILETGQGDGSWKQVEIDPDFEFRKHFEDGNPKADVPDLGGLGLMSDGDQTQSPSEADFGAFEVLYR